MNSINYGELYFSEIVPVLSLSIIINELKEQIKKIIFQNLVVINYKIII